MDYRLKFIATKVTAEGAIHTWVISESRMRQLIRNLSAVALTEKNPNFTSNPKNSEYLIDNLMQGRTMGIDLQHSNWRFELCKDYRKRPAYTFQNPIIS